MLDSGHSVKVRHRRFRSGSETINFTEGFRLFFGASSGQPQRLDIIADSRASLHTLNRTVGLPRAVFAGCLVEVNDLAALLTGLNSLWFPPFGASEHFVVVGERKIGKTDTVRRSPHGWRDNLNAQLLGLLYVVVAAIQRVGLKSARSSSGASSRFAASSIAGISALESLSWAASTLTWVMRFGWLLSGE